MTEPNEAKDFDTIADAHFAELEKETPTDSSSETKPSDQDQTTEPATAEVEKTEQVKEVESDRSLSVEDKIAKIKEILGDDEKAIDAYVKSKGFHKDPAWQKQRELIEKLKQEGKASGLSDEDREALSTFKKLSSSPEFITMSMKSQGYTQEAIDKKLNESGFDVPVKPQDDVNLLVEKLGLNLDLFDPDRKAEVMANLSDISKSFDILFTDRINKVLPKELGPVKDHISSITKSDNASKLVNTMKATVKTEGILDFDKDVEPELNKFMDANPDSSQQDIYEEFKSINHRMTVERLKTGKKKEERDEKKLNLRQNIPFSKSGHFVKKTGNFEADADAFLENANID